MLETNIGSFKLDDIPLLSVVGTVPVFQAAVVVWKLEERCHSPIGSSADVAVQDSSSHVWLVYQYVHLWTCLRDQEVAETAAESAAIHCALYLVFELADVVDSAFPLVHEASTVFAWTVQLPLLTALACQSYVVLSKHMTAVAAGISEQI